MAGFDSLTSTLARLTPVQKIALGAAALTVVAGTVVLTRSESATPMAPVFTDLEASDAAAVTDALASRGVDYELTDGGRTVLVPRDDVYDLRVDLSGDGLPNSSEGYALLDRQGLTTSDFRQRIDYQRALEGELSRTLRAIDGIETATVHLALPEESVFVDEPTRPTASVLVSSSGTTTVSSRQVAAMVHLVASSIKGMSPEDVTIADASGVVLATGGDTGGAVLFADGRTDATAAFESDLAGSIRAMVASVTGPGNVAVTVQADLDLTERQSTSETFDSSDADNGVVVAERTTTETYSGETADTVEPGVLGPDGAMVEPPPAADADSKTYLRDDAERTFAVNRTVSSEVQAPGTVNRVNVAVLVNEAAVSEQQLAAISEMVSTAAGVDMERGDQVTVTRLPFDTAAGEAAVAAAAVGAAAQAKADQMSLIRTGVIGLVVLVAVFLAYRSARRARREVATPIDIGAIRAAPARAAAPIEIDAPGPAAVAPARVNPVADASRAALDELSVLAERRPEEVAQILQGWLADERATT